ncbi:BlaI/MecI/CopY family transcriptional regulator [Streptomyces sp. NPDC090306]|uniref:BlaI/MecI/CopY family transcriptional regulator n=1 Tax=Streptomyces sp. NPDC090306 TaxID=3365961 RepID=UPI00381647D4
MPTTQTPVTSVTSHYAAQVTQDLEKNAAEQERISADITALQEQLDVLQNDQKVLRDVYKAVSGGSASVPTPPPSGSATPKRGPKSATASAPTAAPTAAPAAADKATGKRKSTTPKNRPAKKSTGTVPGASTDKAPSQPTLVELVRSFLNRQTQPLSAAEVTADLAAKHPQRNIKATVVRTTLENLVAKTLVHRTKQGSSVFYTGADAKAAGERTQQDAATSTASAKKES